MIEPVTIEKHVDLPFPIFERILFCLGMMRGCEAIFIRYINIWRSSRVEARGVFGGLNTATAAE